MKRACFSDPNNSRASVMNLTDSNYSGGAGYPTLKINTLRLKTVLKHLFISIIMTLLYLFCVEIKAQPPLIPYEVSKCQDFFGMVEKGDLNSIKQCIARKPEIIQKRNQNGETPLIIAAAGGKYKMVAYLLKSGAAIEDENVLGERAIHLAAKSGNLETVIELVDQGANFMSKTSDGNSPIHYAAESGNISMVRYFEKLGATIFELGADQSSLILWGAMSGNIDLFKFLEQRNLNIQAVDAKGNGALHWAAKGSNVNMCHFLLTQKGFDLRQRNSLGMYPIEMAINFKQFETTKYFLENGMGIQETNLTGGSWLHNAACCGSTAICNYLLQMGCNVNAIDNKGNTPLSIAYALGQHHMVKLLIENGAENKKEVL